MRILKLIHIGLYSVLIPLYTVVGAFFLFALYPFFGRKKHVDFLTDIWSRLIHWTCGIKITREGTENLEPEKSYVFVANHQSLFDITACFVAIPARLRMLAKKELFRVPMFGWGMKAIGHISIDRENREKALTSVDDAVERLKNEDISPVVYPEGTRSADGEIHKFKKGAFVLAIKAKREVVPVTIIGSRKIALKKSFMISSGTIHVVIGKPISTENMTIDDRGDLAEKTQEIISKRFYESAC